MAPISQFSGLMELLRENILVVNSASPASRNDCTYLAPTAETCCSRSYTSTDLRFRRHNLSLTLSMTFGSVVIDEYMQSIALVASRV